MMPYIILIAPLVTLTLFGPQTGQFVSLQTPVTVQTLGRSPAVPRSQKEAETSNSAQYSEETSGTLLTAASPQALRRRNEGSHEQALTKQATLLRSIWDAPRTFGLWRHSTGFITARHGLP